MSGLDFLNKALRRPSPEMLIFSLNGQFLIGYTE
jgi:hypothetical protein